MHFVVGRGAGSNHRYSHKLVIDMLITSLNQTTNGIKKIKNNDIICIQLQFSGSEH